MRLKPVKDLIGAFIIGTVNHLLAVGTVENQHRPLYWFCSFSIFSSSRHNR